MQKITLKNTDLTVSRACFGTMTFGEQTSEEAALGMVNRLVDRGVNFIDTANVYNDGAAETITGKALAGRRHNFVLASKVRGHMSDGLEGLSKASMLRSVDDSLRRLGTDYLDICYLHWPDYTVPIEDSLAATDELVRSGKVRYPAISNYSAWQACQMFYISQKNRWKPPYITQPMYNLIARGIEPEFLPFVKEFGLSTICYNPLAGGLLTGKQKREAPISGTRFDNNKMYLDRYWNDAVFDAVDELRGIAEKAKRSMVSLALNWVLHHTEADCVILGASKLEQLEENLDSLSEGALDAGTTEACDRLWTKLRGVAPKYNR